MAIFILSKTNLYLRYNMKNDMYLEKFGKFEYWFLKNEK